MNKLIYVFALIALCGCCTDSPKIPQAKDIPDVVIEKEMFRRIGFLTIDTCTNCKEKWKSCKCEMGKHPLMFQNRQNLTKEQHATELAKYGVKDE